MAEIKETFEFVSNDKYEDFLKAIGTSFPMRKLISLSHPSITRSEENEKWTQETKSSLKTSKIKFILGEEFEDQLEGGEKCQSVITIEGNKLIHRQETKDISVVITREFNGDEMVSTYAINDVIATCTFKKVA